MWIASHVNAQLSLVNAAGRMIDGIRGRICFTTGPTLRLYKLHPPGTPTGFSQPFASSEEPGSPALAAFDGEPSLWRPSRARPETPSWGSTSATAATRNSPRSGSTGAEHLPMGSRSSSNTRILVASGGRPACSA